MIRALLLVNVDEWSLSVPASWSWWNGYVCKSDLPSTWTAVYSLVRTRESRDQISWRTCLFWCKVFFQIICPCMCRDRCLAVKFALMEKFKNLHIAGFNQIGHFVCNGFLAWAAFLPAKGIVFLFKSARGLSEFCKLLQVSFQGSACAIRPWWHWQVQFCSGRSASRYHVCIVCCVLNEAGQCVISWIHISLVYCQVELVECRIIRDRIADVKFSRLILPDKLLLMIVFYVCVLGGACRYYWGHQRRIGVWAVCDPLYSLFVLFSLGTVCITLLSWPRVPVLEGEVTLE